MLQPKPAVATLNGAAMAIAIQICLLGLECRRYDYRKQIADADPANGCRSRWRLAAGIFSAAAANRTTIRNALATNDQAAGISATEPQWRCADQ